MENKLQMLQERARQLTKDWKKKIEEISKTERQCWGFALDTIDMIENGEWKSAANMEKEMMEYYGRSDVSNPPIDAIQELSSIVYEVCAEFKHKNKQKLWASMRALIFFL